MAGKAHQLFDVQPNGITVFGEESLKRFDSKSWILDNFIQVNAEFVGGELDQLVMMDIENGAQDRIDHVLVSPRIFNILYMEGRISYLQMNDAQEDVEGQTITVSDVQFAGMKCTVKTMPSSVLEARYGNFRMATIDSQGEIV